MKLSDKFDLEITVKKAQQGKLERIVRDNGIPFNAVLLVYNQLVEFTLYGCTFKSVEALKKLMKEEEITVY